MDFAKLLEPYKKGEHGKDITPESQVRWLKRLGFPDDVIDRTMIAVYTEIEQQGPERFKDWQEMHICLKETAKLAQSKDLAAYIQRLQEFESKLRKKWEQEIPWWKRIFGVKKKRVEA
uniref:Uncharacterized protein n=1 Tax=viral metagenome TaxID=1070528 RepID=A0A6M3L5R7_9ZZZZ